MSSFRIGSVLIRLGAATATTGRARHVPSLAQRFSRVSTSSLQNSLKKSISTSRLVQAKAQLPATTVSAGKYNLRLTDAVIDRIKQLQEEDNNPNVKLRIKVDGGGCNGFLIRFEIDESKLKKHDLVFAKDGAQVVSDDISMDLINGATIDFEEEMARSAFTVAENPNAKSSCGCKVSFGIE